MQSKTLYTILLSIIAVLTLALAVLIIFLFSTFNSAKNADPTKPQATANKRVVLPEEQGKVYLYAEGEGDTATPVDAIFNIKKTESNPNSFIMLNFVIVYDCGEKNKLKEKRTELISKTYINELKQATIAYFRSKTWSELDALDAMDKANEELTKSFNSIISPDKPEEKIILKVVFNKFITQ